MNKTTSTEENYYVFDEDSPGPRALSFVNVKNNLFLVNSPFSTTAVDLIAKIREKICKGEPSIPITINEVIKNDILSKYKEEFKLEDEDKEEEFPIPNFTEQLVPKNEEEVEEIEKVTLECKYIVDLNQKNKSNKVKIIIVNDIKVSIKRKITI